MIGTTMSDGGPSPDPDELALMRALARELGAAPEPIEVPAAQDQALRAMARDRARAIRTASGAGRRRWLVAAAAVACAAAVVLALTVGGVLGGGDRETPVASAAVVGDINGDGTVDVIDALSLARDLERGAVTRAACDVTGDGAVDRADVEWITTRAVSLDRGMP